MHDGPCIEIDRTQRKYEFNYSQLINLEILYNELKIVTQTHFTQKDALKVYFKGSFRVKAECLGQIRVLK